jgi:hypothetical protein
MTVESKGRDLFIVDNSVSRWTGLRYLEEWTGIAKAFDIATGYFEIGALLALDARTYLSQSLGSVNVRRTGRAIRRRRIEFNPRLLLTNAGS